MAGTFRWHSCSNTDFPLKRHKVSKACEACRNKKMRCDGSIPARSRNLHSAAPKSPSFSNSLCTDMKTPFMDNKFTFANQTYETFRLQHSPPQCGTSLLPLLFDFFHLTSQPVCIWDSFDHYHKQCISPSSSETTLSESRDRLLREAIRLFVTHNLLYSMFIDSQALPLITLQSDPLLFTACSQSTYPNEYKSSLFPSRHPTLNRPRTLRQENELINDYDLLIMLSILSLTFSSLNEHEKSDSFMEHAMAFYQKAHQLFFQLIFPIVPSDPTYPAPDQKDLLSLLKATILLAHFQCSIISPEQAYRTIRIGIDILQQASLTLNEESLIVLKTIDAWHIWLAFYLGMPYTNVASANVQKELKLSDSQFTQEQQWAFQIVDNCSQFMRATLKRHKSAHPQQAKPSFEFIDHDKNPWLIISLFQHVLKIHLQLSYLSTSFENDYASLVEHNVYTMDSFAKPLQQILDISSQIINYCTDNRFVFLPYPVIYSVCLGETEHFNALCLALKKIAKASSMCKDTLDVVLNQLNHPKSYINTESAIKRREKRRLNKIKKTTAPPSPSPSSSSDVTAVIVSRASTKPSVSMTLCDTPGAIISNTTSQPDTPSTMSQLLAHPVIPNELLLMDNMRTAGLEHMSSHTMNIHSRADIDREQLEKLSHKPSRLQQQYQQYQHEQQVLLQQQQQQQKYQKQFSELDLQQPTHHITSNNHNNPYLFPKYVMAPSSAQNTSSSKAKNDYNAAQVLPPQGDIGSNYNCYQSNKRTYNQHQPSNFNLQAYKKLKSNVNIPSSSTYYNQKQHFQNQGNPPFNHVQEDNELVSTSSQNDRSRQNSLVDTSFIDVNEMGSEPQSADSAALMYWMLDSGENAAAFYQVATTPSTPTGTHPSLPTHDAKSETEILSSPVQQAQFGYQNNNDHNDNPTSQNEPTAAIQSWQPSIEVDENSLNAVTKLPLPQPSKSSAQPTNYWATSASTRTWSKFFFASEVQTLHYQTPPLVHYNESSSFPMSLNMIQEEEDQHRQRQQQQQEPLKPFFYSYNKNLAGKNGTSDKNLVVLPPQPIQATNSNEEAAAAAAAAAIWAAAADKTRPNSNKDDYCTPKRKISDYNTFYSEIKETR
ncbi:hypothetical protein BD560DRAFT_396732 [Blakeslea trispora]|nr:hypothetical protein BD560DRAFT_396732 [Blakeslea trispora]